MDSLGLTLYIVLGVRGKALQQCSWGGGDPSAPPRHVYRPLIDFARTTCVVFAPRQFIMVVAARSSRPAR